MNTATFKAIGWEAENDTFDPKRPYHTSTGVAFSNSAKKAIQAVRDQIMNNSKGWTPICGEIKLYKNNQLIWKED